jgi:small subunit ribosomal protein S6
MIFKPRMHSALLPGLFQLAGGQPLTYTRAFKRLRSWDALQGYAHWARVQRAEAATGVRPLPFRRSNKGPDMALYEHLLIARQDISAQQVDALATHLKTIVEGQGGKVEKQEYWGLRGLAYRIKKNRKGHYVLLNINAPSGAVVELERQLKINEDVLRYLTVKVDQFDVSSNKNRRDDRVEVKDGEEAVAEVVQ